jgi:hypothetical protein
MDRENEKFADQLLAGSLERYARAEPRAGLEGRILAGVKARRQSAHARNWALGLAFSALALVAIFMAVRVTQRTTLPAAPQPPRIAAAQPETTASLELVAPHRLKVAKVPSSKVTPQRPQQFPTPAPLSEQEKLLLLYVKETPKSVSTAPAATTEKDLEIPELKIAALQIKDLPRVNDTE